MPLSVCSALGLTPTKTNQKVTQLDKSEVTVVGELNNIHMQLIADPRIQMYIDIQVVEIPGAYGMLVSRDWTRVLNGWLHSSFTHMWLPWRGVANQIRIESEPRLKLMITEYNQANETLFLESDIGIYRADIGSINEVLLVQCSNPVQNLEGIAESYDKEILSPEESELFSSLMEFFCKYKEQVSHLNHQDSVKNFLLTGWCRVHNAAHSEITCSLCRTALNQAWKRHSEVLQTHALRPEGATFPELTKRRPPSKKSMK